MEFEKGLDFRHKEVINIKNAKRLGYVQDVNADLKTGTITSIIVPGTTKFFNLFSKLLIFNYLYNLRICSIAVFSRRDTCA